MPTDDTYDLAPAPEDPPRAPQLERKKPPALPGGPAPKAKAPAAPTPLVDPDAPLKKVTCPHCGFERYGPAKGKCPKCAAGLDASNLDFLKFAPPGWVRGASLGLLLICAAIATHIAGAAFRYSNLSLAANLHAGAGIILALGVFLATRADPRPQGAGGDWVSRILAVLAGIIWGLIAGLYLKQETPLVKPFIVPGLVIHAMLSVTFSLQCRRLAMRVPDDSIAFQASLGGWLAAIACLLMAFIHSFDFHDVNFLALFFCSFPLILGVSLIFLWGTITVLRLAMGMRACAAEGEDVGTRRATVDAPKSDLV